MSYLIYNDEIIAKTNEKLSNGEYVRWSDTKVDGRLVNEEWAQASNAKEWDNVWDKMIAEACGYAELINSDGIYKRYLVVR